MHASRECASNLEEQVPGPADRQTKRGGQNAATPIDSRVKVDEDERERKAKQLNCHISRDGVDSRRSCLAEEDWEALSAASLASYRWARKRRVFPLLLPLLSRHTKHPLTNLPQLSQLTTA